MSFRNLLKTLTTYPIYIFLFILFVFSFKGFSQNHPYPQMPVNGNSISKLNPTFLWKGGNHFVKYRLTIYSCSYEKGTNFESLNLNDYDFVSAIRGEYAFESSNLTINENRPGCLTTVDDNGRKIVSFKNEFNLPTEQYIYDVEGYDYEGLTYLHNDYFVIVEEKSNQLFFFNLQYGASNDLTGLRYIRSYKFNNNFITGDNKGWEGITYDPINNKLYLIKETNPPSIYEGTCTDAPYFTGSIDLKEPFKLINTSWQPDNISSLYHLSLNKTLSATPVSKHLLILSKATNSVYEFDLTGKLISELNIDAGQLEPYNDGFFKPEGLAYNDGKLYISSDSDWTRNAMYYTYENRQHQDPVSENKKLVFESEDINNTQFNLPTGILQNNTEYCWKVIAYDDTGKSYESNDYSFSAELPCYSYLTHNQSSSIDERQYYSKNYIKSYKRVESRDSLEYYAGEYVDLGNGFETKTGAYFFAGIGEECE